jgi:hypothetical protein
MLSGADRLVAGAFLPVAETLEIDAVALELD